jgi:hypothetical protein
MALSDVNLLAVCISAAGAISCSGRHRAVPQLQLVKGAHVRFRIFAGPVAAAAAANSRLQHMGCLACASSSQL